MGVFFLRNLDARQPILPGMDIQWNALVELLCILTLVYLFAMALYRAVRVMDVALGYEDFEDRI